MPLVHRHGWAFGASTPSTDGQIKQVWAWWNRWATGESLISFGAVSVSSSGELHNSLVHQRHPPMNLTTQPLYARFWLKWLLCGWGLYVYQLLWWCGRSLEGRKPFRTLWIRTLCASSSWTTSLRSHRSSSLKCKSCKVSSNSIELCMQREWCGLATKGRKSRFVMQCG